MGAPARSGPSQHQLAEAKLARIGGIAIEIGPGHSSGLGGHGRLARVGPARVSTHRRGATRRLDHRFHPGPASIGGVARQSQQGDRPNGV